MRRIVLVVAIVTGSMNASATSASACSAGPDFDPRDVTQLLVLGQVRSVELGPRSTGDFREALVTLDVVRTYRGVAGSPLVFVDGASAYRVEDPVTRRAVTRFAGGSGACGTIDDDPVGKFVLIGLGRGDDGRWHANRLFGAIYTTTPDYAMYRWLLERHLVSVAFLVVGSSEPRASAALAP